MSCSALPTMAQASAGNLEGVIAALRQIETSNRIGLSREGDKLIVPESMSIDQAIDFLGKKKKEEENKVVIREVIKAFPFDAAHALALVLNELFGFSGNEPYTQMTMWGPQTFSPQFIPVEVSRGVVKMVPWGGFQIPGIEGVVETSMTREDNRVYMLLSAEVKGKYKGVIHKLAAALREKLKTDSIYRGKAFKMNFRDENDEQVFFNPSKAPEFMDLRSRDTPIFNRSTEHQIQLSVLNIIENTPRVRERGLKLKRSVLLEGDYGTGKTLLALHIARACEANGWTFLYVSDCRDIGQALSLAEQYGPAVVFAEDVDRIMGGKRDQQMDALSYVLDGVDNKNKEIVTVLTTNNIKGIQKLMLRPGRIDSVVSVRAPDEETTFRLLSHFADGKMEGDELQFREAISSMVGQNPAFVVEVVNKAELSAIIRGSDKITPDDIRASAALIKNHLDLMNPEPESESKPVDFSSLTVNWPNGRGKQLAKV